MSIKITPDQLLEVLEIHFNSEGKNNQKMPILIEGTAGIGKTSIVHQFAQSKGVKCFEYRAAYAEPGDLKGLCNASPDGKEMNFLRPEDFPKETDENCILFFDEINRATTSVINCVLQATDGSGRIATHKLPKGCLCVAAINPDSNEYNVNNLDDAVRSRFGIYELVCNAESLTKHAIEKNWDFDVIGFISENTGIFSANKSEGNENIVTPRTLDMLSTTIKNIKDRKSNIFLAICQAFLGGKAGSQFFAFCSDNCLVTWEKVEKDPKKSFKLLTEQCNREKYRADLINVTLQSVNQFLDNNNSKLDFDLLYKFIDMVSIDQVCGWGKLLIKSKHSKVLSELEKRGFTSDRWNKGLVS